MTSTTTPLLIGGLGGMELLIILAVLLLLFGASKLPELARGSGQALRIFKSETKGLMDDDKSATKDEAEPKHVAAPADVAVDPIIVETPRGQDASRG
ncbi:twin-arginine translocase TatA/TatE family subunit [Nocardioides cavernae]|uniref:Sec-independent protein translocase protein TatA n=1 Tax=Nocardioides cavernae TaxID=1921566 RepID=A0ABR8NDR7_9ACTN|nr:twin-arginine translocase TatA/TatE family subunit [Nocardioides cavernae]MBD3926274.1 twin-arginine translocase TatA/TatE family subunit [Nocardioides cavernae]MBM7513867.1 sec-independent protein translocase protein TatA [Nocardioides cavernae]